MAGACLEYVYLHRQRLPGLLVRSSLGIAAAEIHGYGMEIASGDAPRIAPLGCACLPRLWYLCYDDTAASCLWRHSAITLSAHLVCLC